MRAAFLHKLASSWLPELKFALLYRGSRDGMTPCSFHKHCDRRGATLTLVRSSNGFVFGGFTNSNWDKGKPRGKLDAGAFLFSVTSPYVDALVRYELKQEGRLRPGQSPMTSIQTGSELGPTFGVSQGADLALVAKSASRPFDGNSHCRVGTTYADAIGKGHSSFSGTPEFVPIDIEVFRVFSD
ncbi:MAG: TLD domain-containing protein [Formivibrio sp.]|nr:TLD domain-containing protein [Formivibrio sp.]